MRFRRAHVYAVASHSGRDGELERRLHFLCFSSNWGTSSAQSVFFARSFESRVLYTTLFHFSLPGRSPGIFVQSFSLQSIETVEFFLSFTSAILLRSVLWFLCYSLFRHRMVRKIKYFSFIIHTYIYILVVLCKLDNHSFDCQSPPMNTSYIQRQNPCTLAFVSCQYNIIALPLLCIRYNVY